MSKPKDRKESNPTGDVPATVPKAVISRLSLYLRELQRLQRAGHETVSSTQLGKLLGLTDAQIRKDLAYFGQFGYPGIGYRCMELVEAIRSILGTNQAWNVALVGLGNLGRALLRYRGFANQGFRIISAFDIDPRVVGREIENVPVRHLDDFAAAAQQEGIRVAIIAVPATAAQDVARRLIDAGVEGLLNFAPVTLAVPDDVSVVSVDLAIELEQLVFNVVRRPKDG